MRKIGETESRKHRETRRDRNFFAIADEGEQPIKGPLVVNPAAEDSAVENVAGEEMPDGAQAESAAQTANPAMEESTLAEEDSAAAYAQEDTAQEEIEETQETIDGDAAEDSSAAYAQEDTAQEEIEETQETIDGGAAEDDAEENAQETEQKTADVAVKRRKEPEKNEGNRRSREHGKKRRKKKKKKGWVVAVCILGVLVLIGAVAAVYLYPALQNPQSLFETTGEAQSTPKPMNPQLGEGEEAEETQNLFADDHSINILLMGIDQDYKDYAKDGGDFHTDAIIVLRVDFDNKTLDMISLPRDGFTHVPGVKGIYKLNAAINVGGGKTDAGFQKVCETASWYLGGVPIDYYAAFELETVTQIGDLIGGVDFDVDMAYTGTSGQKYKKGMQHLDGTGINDYMRARKNATSGTPGDKGRMERCKKMLIAIFQKIKEENMIGQIPSLLSAVNEGLYTNLTTQQIVALGNLAYGVDMDNIGAYVLDGNVNIELGWTFYFVDQEARIELIEDLYGVTVPPLELASRQYAQWLGETGFTTVRYLTTAYEVIEYADNYASMHYMSDETKDLLDETKDKYTEAQTAYDTAAQFLTNAADRNMTTTRRELRELTEDLADAVGYEEDLSWTVMAAWNEDPCINEVNVDFH